MNDLTKCLRHAEAFLNSLNGRGGEGDFNTVNEPDCDEMINCMSSVIAYDFDLFPLTCHICGGEGIILDHEGNFSAKCVCVKGYVHCDFCYDHSDANPATIISIPHDYKHCVRCVISGFDHDWTFAQNNDFKKLS